MAWLGTVVMPHSPREEEFIRGRRLGKRKWRKHVMEVAKRLKAALEAEDLVLGGGNAKKLKGLPAGARHVDNANAFVGGFRLWDGKSPGKAKADAAVLLETLPEL